MVVEKTPQILMVMNGPPWSEWTMSGVSKGTCSALWNRDALYGAISYRCLSNKDFSSPTKFYAAKERVLRLINHSFPKKIRPWLSEEDDGLAQVLDRLPYGTPIIYTYVNPTFSQNRHLRRFRWIGISILDAVKHKSYGYEVMDDKAVLEGFQQQSETIHQSESIFTHSSYGADSIARDFGYPRERIFPIGAGASIQFQGPMTNDISRYQRANILFVGRDWERKGGPLAFEAFLLLKKRIPHATFTIVGPVFQPVFGDGVIFEGFLRKHKYLERRRIKKLYLRASLFCTPSVCETWGLVYVEAAASGLPIVGTSEWAMPDIVIDGKSGVLVKERKPEVLANALFQVLDDPYRSQKMGEAGIKHVDEVLDWHHVADRILAVVCPEALGGREPVWLPKDGIRPNEFKNSTAEE